MEPSEGFFSARICRKGTNVDMGFTKQDSICLKGVAIWIMMFHHCFMEEERFEGYVVDFSPFSQDFAVDVSAYFKICVAIFAFITGYGLYLSAKGRCGDARSAETWIGIRLLKTLSGFWAVYVLVFISTQIFAGYPVEIYCEKGWIRGAVYALIDLLGLAQFFSTPTLIGTWWYMSAAVMYIILIPVLIRWVERLGYVTLFGVVAFFAHCVWEGYPGGMSIYTFLPALIFGMMFAQYGLFEKLDRIEGGWIRCILYHIVLAGSVLLWIRLPMDRLWVYHMAVAPVIFICYCKRYVVRLPILKEILLFCGRHSMNIFLVHTFIRYVFFADFIYGFRYFWLIALVLFSISAGISVVIEFLKRCVGYERYIDSVCGKISRIGGG